jgi:hypothetical protein
VLRRVPILTVAVSLAVALAVLARGGYTAPARALFVVAAGAALFAALARDERDAVRAARELPVVALAAIGALALFSALWTVGEPADALRWGMVVLGYAALAVAGSVLARDAGAARPAAIIAGAAALAGAVGLVAVAIHEKPYALLIEGLWRPGGTFEYPPALALLQVSALPALLRWMTAERASVALPAAAFAAQAVALVALAASRLELALAAALLAAVVAAPGPTLGITRRRAATAVALLLAAGAAAHLIAGGEISAGQDEGGDLARLLGLLAVMAATALAWQGARQMEAGRPTPDGGARPWRFYAAGALAGFVVVAGAAGLAASAEEPQRAGGDATGLTHGRIDLWGDAAGTALDRPLGGAGAEAFLDASREHQDGRPVRYAHSLPLELWAELGPLGLALVLLLYGSAAWAVWRARGSEAGWLLGPAVLAFLAANLVDWPWHLAGAGAVWALALGGVLAARGQPGGVRARSGGSA